MPPCKTSQLFLQSNISVYYLHFYCSNPIHQLHLHLLILVTMPVYNMTLDSQVSRWTHTAFHKMVILQTCTALYDSQHKPGEMCNGPNHCLLHMYMYVSVCVCVSIIWTIMINQQLLLIINFFWYVVMWRFVCWPSWLRIGPNKKREWVLTRIYWGHDSTYGDKGGVTRNTTIYILFPRWLQESIYHLQRWKA